MEATLDGIPSDSAVNKHRAGRLLALELTTFMMCDKFICRFNINTTYFVDRGTRVNEAIFQAIIVGLTDWTQVNKGDESISGLIQNGKETAHIKVTLDNTGFNCYQKNNFGNVIVIEHALYRDENSVTCRIKGATGKIIYQDHYMLEEIMLHFNIRVFNMISLPILHLVSPDYMFEHDAYEMLLKMTSMGNAWKILAQLKDQAKNSIILLDTKKQGLINIKNHLDTLEVRWNRVKVVKELRARIDVLQGAFPWAIVIKEEAKLQSLIETRDNPDVSLRAKDRLNHQVMKQREIVTTAVEVAINVCPQRVDLLKTVEQVKRELREHEQMVHILEEENGVYSTVLVEVTTQRQRYEVLNAKINELQSAFTILQETLSTRNREYMRIQKLEFERAAMWFETKMNDNYGVTARLEVDHEAKTAKPQGSFENVPIVEVFAVYITALWELSDMPFFLFYNNCKKDNSNSEGVKLLWKFMSDWTHTKKHSQFISALPSVLDVAPFRHKYVRKESCIYIPRPRSIMTDSDDEEDDGVEHGDTYNTLQKIFDLIAQNSKNIR